jgi:hypothetical protein
VSLLDRPGVPQNGDFGCSGANIDVWFDDEAALPAETSCEQQSPAVSGQRSPNQLLEAFDGQTLAGTWQLTTVDMASFDTGTLGEWCLLVETAEPYYCNDVSEIPMAECRALVSLYDRTRGRTWQHQDNWLETNTPCDWYGVTCTANHVSGLELANNSLSGLLPGLLGDLEHLRTLDLASNRLRGPLPQALNRLDLQHFSYHTTQLCAPANPDFHSWLSTIADLKPTGRTCSHLFLPLAR